MLYNDNPRTIKDFDENKKRLKTDAERETMSGKRKMQIEEQKRKQLKISDKKREIDELTRGLASKETFLRRAVSELDMLRSEKQREERKLKELEQKSAVQKPANDERLAEETAKLKNIDQETSFLKQDLYREKKQAEQRLSVKESDRQDEKRKIDDIRIRIMSKTSEMRRLEQEISLLKQEEQRHEQLLRNLESQTNPQDQEISKKETELAKKLNEEERLKKDLGILEREKNMRQKATSGTGIRNEKSALEMIERRILAVGSDIEKANREITGLKTDLQKKNGELRALMA